MAISIAMLFDDYIFYTLLEYSEYKFIIGLGFYTLIILLILMVSKLLLKAKEVNLLSFRVITILAPLLLVCSFIGNVDYFEDKYIKLPSFIDLSKEEIDFEDKFKKLKLKKITD